MGKASHQPTNCFVGRDHTVEKVTEHLLQRASCYLYEDNVSGMISNERFAMMSTGYEDEQKMLKATVAKLTAFIETT